MTIRPNFLTSRPVGHVLIFAFGLGLWFINRSYVGFVEHDARVYTLLVQRTIDADAFARDPFFLFGAQDKFAIFTWVHGLLAGLTGLDVAGLVAAFSGGVLFVIASQKLAGIFVQGHFWIALGTMAAAIASINYSPNADTFHINENFPTARSIAFPLGLMACAVSVGAHRAWAMALGVSCLALHPLIGVWVLAVVIGMQLSERWILRGALGIVAVTAALVAMQVGPLQRLDAEWESILRASSRDIFVGPLGVARISPCLAVISLLLLAAEAAKPRLRKLIHLAALCGTGGFFLAQLASYHYPAALIVQAQTWRGMWLSFAFSVFCTLLLGEMAWNSRFRTWWAVAGLLALLLVDWVGYIGIAVWFALRGGYLSEAGAKIGPILLQHERLGKLLLAALILSHLPGYVVDLTILGAGLPSSTGTGILIFDGLVLAGGLGVGLILWSLAAALWPRYFSLAAAFMLAYGLLHWDQRAPAYRAWEAMASAQIRPFEKIIARGDVVFWINASPQRAWIELGTANYASSDQVIGGVFSREKTFEMLRRRQRLAVGSVATHWPLSSADESRFLNGYRHESGLTLDAQGNLHESFKRPLTLTGPGMLYLCEDDWLDWVISPQPLEQGMLQASMAVASNQNFWLYDCRKLRGNASRRAQMESNGVSS